MIGWLHLFILDVLAFLVRCTVHKYEVRMFGHLVDDVAALEFMFEQVFRFVVGIMIEDLFSFSMTK